MLRFSPIWLLLLRCNVCISPAKTKIAPGRDELQHPVDQVAQVCQQLAVVPRLQPGRHGVMRFYTSANIAL